MADVKKRMEWLDAMRGFTMILVVAYHVAKSGFVESEKISASLPFLVLFRMPLFFFVSGFLAYKAKWVWTTSSFLQLTWKKVKIQVLPTFIFLCICLALRSKLPFADGLSKSLSDVTKGGYWFTWSLLQMFLIYYVFASIAQKIGKYGDWLMVFLWVLSLGAYESLYLSQHLGKWYSNDFMNYSSLTMTFKYLNFFVIGNIAHRHWDKVQQLFDNKWFSTILITVALICSLELFKWHYVGGEWGILPKTIAMYSLMILVILFFRHYRDSFTKETRIGQGLQYIGVRTLDIYLIHFILMPSIPAIGVWLDDISPNFIVDVVVAISFALVIIAFCCIISNILRISPIFREYLFGRK